MKKPLARVSLKPEYRVTLGRDRAVRAWLKKLNAHMNETLWHEVAKRLGAAGKLGL